MSLRDRLSIRLRVRLRCRLSIRLRFLNGSPRSSRFACSLGGFSSVPLRDNYAPAGNPPRSAIDPRLEEPSRRSDYPCRRRAECRLISLVTGRCTWRSTTANRVVASRRRLQANPARGLSARLVPMPPATAERARVAVSASLSPRRASGAANTTRARQRRAAR